VRVRAGDYAALVTALVGVWIFWSEFSQLRTLSWWYDRVQLARSSGVMPNPTYDLASLPWQTATPRVFEHGHDPRGAITLVTSADPFAYQLFATVNTDGAAAADIQFDIDVQTGGVTIGLLQAGKWIAVSSSTRPGRFDDSNSTQLGYSRSLTVMIANDNPAGESRLLVKSVRLYLRR